MRKYKEHCSLTYNYNHCKCKGRKYMDRRYNHWPCSCIVIRYSSDFCFNWFIKRLPYNRFIQKLTIVGIVSDERVNLILYANHRQRVTASVSECALGGRSNAHNATFGDRKYLAIDLKFAIARGENIELLVGFMRV